VKISEMEKVLREEFPGRYVSFQIEISAHNNLRTPEVQTRIFVYTTATGFIHGDSFEDCVAALHRALGVESLGVKDVEVEF